MESLKGIEEEVYLYMDTKYYQEIEGVNFGYIDAQKYTILPKQKEIDFTDYEKILGRYFKKSDKAKIFVYVGEYDEYAPDDGQE